MSQRKAALLTSLDQNRQTLNGVLVRLKPSDWELRVQEGDQMWTVRQFLTHIVDAQKGMTGQMRRINAGEEAIPPDFDLNRWNRRAVEKGAAKTPEELLAGLEADRGALVEFLNGLADSDLDKRGRHSTLQIMSIEEIARLIGTHEAEHAEQIAAKIG